LATGFTQARIRRHVDLSAIVIPPTCIVREGSANLRLPLPRRRHLHPSPRYSAQFPKVT